MPTTGDGASTATRAVAMAATLFQAAVVGWFTFSCLGLGHPDAGHARRLAAGTAMWSVLVLMPLRGGALRVLRARAGEPMPGRVFLSLTAAGLAAVAVACMAWGVFALAGADGARQVFENYSARDVLTVVQVAAGIAAACLSLIAFDPVLGRWMTFRGGSRQASC